MTSKFETILTDVRDDTCSSFSLLFEHVSYKNLQRLKEAIKTNTVLTYIFFEQNRFDDTCIALIADIIKENMTIQQIHIKNNAISNQGIYDLSQALKKKYNPYKHYFIP